MSKNRILDPLIVRVVNDRRFEYLDVLGPAGADVNTKDKRGEPLVVTMVKDTRYDYRSGTVNLNTVNPKFHLIRSNCEIFFYHFPNISCLRCTVNSNFHLIRSKTLLTNDFELTVPNLYLEFLVRAGADVNAMDKENNTALITVANNLRDTEFASKCVKLLLSAGAEVNIMNSRSLNALSECIMSHVGRPLNRKLCMMLFAAGETIVEAVDKTQTPVPEFLLHKDLDLCLNHLCREVIRKHLMQMSQVNLFIRIPQLGLPSLITDFLLYGEEL